MDPTLRVQQVEIRKIGGLRTPAALAQAVEGAYRAAVLQRLPRSDEPRVARPVARRVTRVSPRPNAALLNRHQIRYRDVVRPRPRRATAATGSSANECVRVSVPPTGPRGELDVEPGWLASTTRTKLGAAITEAFIDAYARRDQS